MIQEALENSVCAVESRDTRFDPEIGICYADPATAFYHRDGGYVVRNDRTGGIVQVSDRNNPVSYFMGKGVESSEAKI